MIQKCAPRGEYILSASGCLSQETPLEHLAAMVAAAEKYGKYPLETH
ncbi:MAG: hypothetical protein P8Y37_04510 [Anaerolineales bacterium]